VRTEATAGAGIDRLVEAVDRFRTHSDALLALRRRNRVGTQLRAILADRLMKRVESRIAGLEMERLIDRIATRETDPYTAAEEILK
jgi:LAO/AO transport system kinase